ncbi:MAG: Rho termination factor N-terminal domain-containing protein [Mariprofundaceae bacterium]|nr:Rho termination factor N-terminal domain-containing protein [Mariprofundaceae bacterium]
MLLSEIRLRAKEMNLKNTAKLRKGDLIRAIQSAEGNLPCFDEPWNSGCRQYDCVWKDDCINIL